MLGLLSYALKQAIIELCQEKSSNHEKHGWNFYSQAVFLQLLFLEFQQTVIFHQSGQFSRKSVELRKKSGV